MSFTTEAQVLDAKPIPSLPGWSARTDGTIIRPDGSTAFQFRAGASMHRSVTIHGMVRRYVHHLVLEAFVGPRPKGMECCHWDDDATNNRLSNLRWGTRLDNMQDRIRNGRAKAPFGEANGNAKLTADQASEIRALRVLGVPTRTLARRFNVSRSLVQFIERGRVWRHAPVIAPKEVPPDAPVPSVRTEGDDGHRAG
jgi:hypothetical protein